MALVAVALVGSAGAAPTTDTTAVAFVDIPAKQIWGNNSVNPGKFESVVVIGGTTTVPTNATTVRLEVTVKGAADGTLKFYPAGNEAGGAGHTLSWTAGSTNTTVTKENVGQQNKVSVFNTSTKAAVVTIKVTGYSTQVTAGDINGSGGTAGQVLTNNGTGGATWATPASVDTAKPGELQSGIWVVGSGNAGQLVNTEIAFQRKVLGGVTPIFVPYQTTGPSQCPGPGQAAPGYLCVYTAWNYGAVNFYGLFNPANSSPANGVSPMGSALYMTANGTFQGNARGTWTVRAPLSASAPAARQSEPKHASGVAGR